MASMNLCKCPNCKTKITLSPMSKFKSFKHIPCPHCGTLIGRRLWSAMLFLCGMLIAILPSEIFNPDHSDFTKQIIVNGNGSALEFIIVAWAIAWWIAAIIGSVNSLKFHIVKPDEADNP